EDQLDRMRKQAAEFGQDRLARAAETISNGLVEMRGATSPRLLLELMCAQVLLPAVSAHESARGGSAEVTASSELAARVERLERQLASGAASGPRPETGGGPRSETGGRPRSGQAVERVARGRGPESGRSAAGAPPEKNATERSQAASGEAAVTLDLDVLQS